MKRKEWKSSSGAAINIVIGIIQRYLAMHARGHDAKYSPESN